MAFVTADRVKETTLTAGTGPLTLAGAEAQFKAFSDVASNLDTMHYAIIGQGGSEEWEVGLGTWNTGNVLTRVAADVLSGSAGKGVLTAFAEGVKDVFITVPASQIETLRAGIAAGLASTTTEINISASEAPVRGQALIATSGTAATWQSLNSNVVNNPTVVFEDTSHMLVSYLTVSSDLSINGNVMILG